MKRLISLLLSAIIFLAPAASVLAWGDDGHQTVGKIASLRLSNELLKRLPRF
jgi:hypothetical protein